SSQTLAPDTPAVVESRFPLMHQGPADGFALMRPSNCNFLPRSGFWPKDASLPEGRFWPSQLHRITKQLRPAGFDGARSATANPAEQGVCIPLLHNCADLRYAVTTPR
ncbi:hypothetical protein, partial [Paraburkholderia domus]|uniref:hypothetical protein n=1 Tax=Paraburkholderia domus TaxID=2793075 RepID=UPI001B8C766E